jgi:hypothetical protein
MPIKETLPFRQWCRAKGLSVSSGYKIKNSGLGPELLEVPGIRGARVTPEADAIWERRMAEAAQSQDAQLEAERRRAQAVQAGRIAAQSPQHVSRQPRSASRQRRARR